VREELSNLQEAAKCASELHLQVNAGHGINYANIELIHQIPHLTELNIGHSIMARAVFIGLQSAVHQMLGAMQNYNG
jgi:pyridoxine 5-phosphate synthase